MSFLNSVYHYVRGNLRDVFYKYVNMGHTQSLITTNQLLDQAHQLRKTTLLTHSEFFKAIEVLNEICDGLHDYGGMKMIFCVKRGTDESLLWKALVRIQCFTVSSTSGSVQSIHLINLKQFVHLYDEVTKYLHKKGNKDAVPSDRPVASQSEVASGSSQPITNTDMTMSTLVKKINRRHSSGDDAEFKDAQGTDASTTSHPSHPSPSHHTTTSPNNTLETTTTTTFSTTTTLSTTTTTSATTTTTTTTISTINNPLYPNLTSITHPLSDDHCGNDTNNKHVNNNNNNNNNNSNNSSSATTTTATTTSSSSSSVHNNISDDGFTRGRAGGGGNKKVTGDGEGDDGEGGTTTTTTMGGDGGTTTTTTMGGDGGTTTKTTMGGDGGVNDSSDDECIICMNHRPQIILPCSHAYCEACIEQWQKIQRDCPVCRAVVKREDEGWVLGQIPEVAEVEEYGMEYIMSLVQRCPLDRDDDEDVFSALMGDYDDEEEEEDSE